MDYSKKIGELRTQLNLKESEIQKEQKFLTIVKKENRDKLQQLKKSNKANTQKLKSKI